jgi:hypothetical protein
MNQALKPHTPLLNKHPDLDTKDVWVLSWCQQASILHIETLDQMLTGHIKAFGDDRNLQYIPLLIGDRAVIDAAAEEARPTVQRRYEQLHRGDEAAIPFDELP